MRKTTKPKTAPKKTRAASGSALNSRQNTEYENTMMLRILVVAALVPRALALLQPRALSALPYANVTPTGWLRAELWIQADGLQGAMPDKFAPYNNSQWLNGTDRTQDWMEAFPYLLVGSAGQAFLLRDGAAIARVLGYVEHVLAVAAAQGGWLGPLAAAGQEGGMTYWPRWPVCMVLFVFREPKQPARTKPKTLTP